jgi:opacity protein-like surface antigen
MSARLPVPYRLASLAMLPLLAVSTARAAEWEHALSPYLWATGMSGTAGIATPLGPVDADFNLSFSDILSNLSMAAMVNYEGRTGKWVVLSDLVYMDLSATKNSDLQVPLSTSTRADFKQLAIEVDGGYFITDWIALYAGARYNDLEGDLRVDITTPLGTNRRSASGGASWVDPLVGLLGHFPLTDHWSWDLKADIGGFGAGAELTWQVMTGLRWQLNDAWDLTASYRYLDIDYEDEGGSGIIRYDVVAHGPMLGATWRF